MADVWTKNPQVLLSKQNLQYFVPTEDMTYVEKINAITRFIIYGSVMLFLVRGESLILLLPIVSMIIIYFLVSWGLGIDELKESFDNEKKKECMTPTLNNPFMNVMITDSRDREEACDYTEETKSQIEAAFDSNLYKDTNDLFGRNNSQRQFYTTPNTSIPNNQKEFANWLYGNKN